MKRKARLSLIFSILFFILVYLCWYAIDSYRDYQNTPKDHLIGNKASNVRALKEKGFPFSFLVVGDTHNREMAESLMKSALREKSYSFMIIVGDFVKQPDIWDHRFFLTEMTTEIKPPFPVFLVAGNHDIDYTSLRISEKKRRVTPEVYESFYGARNFDFTFNQCLFIICDIDPKNQTGYITFLRDVLFKKSEGKKYIFVFIHYPPKGVPDDNDAGLPNEDEFFSLLETYKVTTCFFGHYHGYGRGQRRGVNLIVSGGGGGHLKESKSPWGKFHHILKVKVDQNIITEGMITHPEKFSIEDSFEGWVWDSLFPMVENKGWILYILVIIFLSSGIYSLIFFVNSLRKKFDEHKES